MKALEALLRHGLDEHVYPFARLEVLHEGRHAVSLGNAAPSCVFDIASVTKIMGTTALVLATGLPLPARVCGFFPHARVDATVADLLFHRSGLPAWAPFFVRDAPVLDAVLATPAANRREALYSDLGFILLGAILERFASTPLDRLFTERVAAPLGLGAGYRRISSRLPLPRDFAPTGTTRPREPAPGQEGLWDLPARPSPPAEVDDDNAYAMDGVAGHAGLFSTALDAARFGQAVLEGRMAPPVPWHADESTPGSTRALGFDTPSAHGASCGARFGGAGPRGAIGHVGFTGTSLWIDLDRRLVVAFFTNRVAYGRANTRIRDFRPRVHDAVLDALGL